MKSRLLVLLAIAGTFPLLGYAVSDPKKQVMVSGSGDGEDTKVAAVKPQNSDDEDDDFFMEGSGLKEDEPEVPEEIGSGVEVIPGAVAPQPKLKGKCVELDCWCVYENGTEVPGTRAYATSPTQCTVEKVPVKSTTKTQPEVPTRAPETAAPQIIEVETEEPDIILEVEDEDETTTTEKVSTVAHVKSTTMKEEKPYIDNKLTAAPPRKDDDQQKMEEETNHLDNDFNFSAVKSEKAVAAGFISHPGILAAIIGGGIVGLLCAILLVMFIIYRMRKKDEGSYPLNDSKPLKDYAYSKAPSREFYA